MMIHQEDDDVDDSFELEEVTLSIKNIGHWDSITRVPFSTLRHSWKWHVGFVKTNVVYFFMIRIATTILLLLVLATISHAAEHDDNNLYYYYFGWPTLHEYTDHEYVQSLMTQVTEPGAYAGWIAAPRIGINNQPLDFPYVRF